jgi:hypothetical protein
MKNDQTADPSIVACLDRADGSIFRMGATSHIVGPAMIDPLHVMLGVECDDWGVCLYLTVTDALRLNRELNQLLAGLAKR